MFISPRTVEWHLTTYSPSSGPCSPG
ncbi:hypothetical protein [Streptomyces sp. NPDC060035]